MKKPDLPNFKNLVNLNQQPQPASGNWHPETGIRKLASGNWQLETGNQQPATSNQQPATSNQK